MVDMCRTQGHLIALITQYITQCRQLMYNVTQMTNDMYAYRINTEARSVTQKKIYVVGTSLVSSVH